MSDRSPVQSFGKKRRFIHCKANVLGGALLILAWFGTLFYYLPRLIFFRLTQGRHPTRAIPKVQIYSDNLDEINGIAINARQVVSHLRQQGCDLELIGIAFHTREGGFVEANGTRLLPQLYSMEQVGYNESELAIPSLGDLLDYWKINRPDLVEIETPSTGGMMVATAAKILGIPIISHYRTDIFAYSDLLVSSKALVLFIKTWVTLFNRFTAPVIVPSTFFLQKLQDESRLQAHQVRYLERGIPLQSFAPSKARQLWEEFLPQASRPKARFLYVGRISKEKDLEFLLKLWADFRIADSAELLFVGQGPFLEEMKQLCASWPEVAFTGKLFGDDLAAIYAEAQFFVFPSGTDTFGNVVVEALASGTPALVSDMGGPRDIVDGASGWVIPFRNTEQWMEQLRRCARLALDPIAMQQLHVAAVQRSSRFQLAKAALQLWDFYMEILHSPRIPS